jgi:hypothetical protein
MIADHIAAEANRPPSIGLSLNKNIYKALHRDWHKHSCAHPRNYQRTNARSAPVGDQSRLSQRRRQATRRWWEGGMSPSHPRSSRSRILACMPPVSAPARLWRLSDRYDLETVAGPARAIHHRRRRIEAKSITVAYGWLQKSILFSLQ